MSRQFRSLYTMKSIYSNYFWLSCASVVLQQRSGNLLPTVQHAVLKEIWSYPTMFLICICHTLLGCVLRSHRTLTGWPPTNKLMVTTQGKLPNSKYFYNKKEILSYHRWPWWGATVSVLSFGFEVTGSIVTRVGGFLWVREKSQVSLSLVGGANDVAWS